MSRYFQTGPDTVLYLTLHDGPMIDVVGSEDIINGDFSAGDTGWTVGANWDTSSGKAVHTAGSSAALVSTGTAPVPGKLYRVTFSLSDRTAANVAVTLGGASGGSFSADQKHVVYITSVDATKLKFTPAPNTFDGAIDNVFVKAYARRVFDYSLNGNTGRLENAPDPSSGQLLPKFPGYEFNGSSTFIDIGNHGGAIKTVVMWVKPDDVAGNDYPIDLNGTDFLTIETGTLTKNGFAGGTTVLYTDGVVATTITANWHCIAITDTSAKTASDLDIGRESTNYFNGLIGEVLLSTNVLTPTEIRSLYETSRRRYGV